METHDTDTLLWELLYNSETIRLLTCYPKRF